jgi:hypothetical protein
MDPEDLASAYRQLFYAIDGKTTEEAIVSIWEQFGTQMIGLPEHLYDRDAVRRAIEAQVLSGETPDVLEASRRWGYSRRWVKDVIRNVKHDQHSLEQVENDGEELS